MENIDFRILWPSEWHTLFQLQEALDKSEVILQEVEAIRDYVKDELRPKMYELHSQDVFIIEAMSTTFVSLNIMRRFAEKMEGYVFRLFLLSRFFNGF